MSSLRPTSDTLTQTSWIGGKKTMYGNKKDTEGLAAHIRFPSLSYYKSFLRNREGIGMEK